MGPLPPGGPDDEPHDQKGETTKRDSHALASRWCQPPLPEGENSIIRPSGASGTRSLRYGFSEA